MVRLLAFVFALMLAPAAHAQGAQDTLTLETTKGRIVIRLRADIAPQHATRMKTLAREKYYDNAPFHRVIDGFMAQTGDGERGDGTGKSKYSDLRAEFSNVPFTRGVVGMARGAHSNDSANSQFFIVFGDAPGLNGQYTVVGTVTSGMDVVDKLKKGSRALDGKVSDPDRIVSAR
jgi:cyclophilin family peptidyl-prolyl cis-trans isomerase